MLENELRMVKLADARRRSAGGMPLLALLARFREIPPPLLYTFRFPIKAAHETDFSAPWVWWFLMLLGVSPSLRGAKH